MSRHESTLGRATYQFGNQADVDRFVAALESFERGDLDAEAWRKFRLENGTYGQRQEGDLSMLRAKIPQGVLYSDQARAIASVTDTYSRGFCHITTRQNVQFHFVKFANVEAAMRDLAAAGLTCREACGNSVRAITAPPTAGVARDEAFDVTPYANALTHHLLRHKLASGLPRKFKIAFSGGGRDHAFALVNDIGFRAELVDARRVFRVSVGGGTATLCASGTTLVDALEPRDIFVLAEGILRVFDAHGDREHRHKARMKYLVKRIGWDAFRAQVIEQYELARAEREARDGDRPSVRGPTLLSLVEEEEARARARSSRLPDIAALRALAHQSAPRLLVGHDRAARWRATNVQPQKQDGFVVATVVLPLGDVTSGQLRALAEIADAFSDGEMRTTHGQNIVLRWVRVDDVGALHERLAAIDLAATDPDSAADVTSCPGAESCKLAVTQSRGAATRIGERFAERLALLDEAGPLDVRVSGCPNGCVFITWPESACRAECAKWVAALCPNTSSCWAATLVAIGPASAASWPRFQRAASPMRSNASLPTTWRAGARASALSTTSRASNRSTPRPYSPISRRSTKPPSARTTSSTRAEKSRDQNKAPRPRPWRHTRGDSPRATVMTRLHALASRSVCANYVRVAGAGTSFSLVVMMSCTWKVSNTSDTRLRSSPFSVCTAIR